MGPIFLFCAFRKGGIIFLLNPEFNAYVKTFCTHLAILHCIEALIGRGSACRNLGRNLDVNHVVRKNCAAIKLLGGHEDEVKTKV